MPPAAHRVVIAGGGIAAIETLLALRAIPNGPQFAVTVVAPGQWLNYRPLAIEEPFGRASKRSYRLDDICEDLGATLVRGIVTRVDAHERAIVTGRGARLPYDAAVIAAGGRQHETLPHAHTFMADDDPESYQWILRELQEGRTRRLAFVAPPSSGWQLPLYELALMTAHRVAALELPDVELTLLTSEDAPLAVFQGAGSAAVAGLLQDAGVSVQASAYVTKYEHGRLWWRPGERHAEMDRVVALPQILGPSIGGLPCDEQHFIQVTADSRVLGLEDVYAVGDATTFPIKQGGVATQQADVAAALIARAAGAAIPEPLTRPRMRAILLTGDRPLYLQATITGGESEASSATYDCPWWPPHKIAARHLAPYLADRTAERPEASTPLAQARLDARRQLADVADAERSGRG